MTPRVEVEGVEQGPGPAWMVKHGKYMAVLYTKPWTVAGTVSTVFEPQE